MYATKDLALAKEKAKDYKVDLSIIQTDVRQILYFKQLFKIFELMGVKDQMLHLAYEMVRLPEGAMSSRSGNIVSYDELIPKANGDIYPWEDMAVAASLILVNPDYLAEKSERRVQYFFESEHYKDWAQMNFPEYKE